MICWICGDIANSGEHKIKKSSLVKMYKNDFDKKTMLYCNENNNTVNKLPEANSKKLKYLNTICSYCNNSRTQNFDIAYDIFFNYCLLNKEMILRRRMIDFFDVYGESFPKLQTDLFKYFVKLFGCDLHANGNKVPQDLINLLDKSHFKTGLKISFAINETNYYLNNNIMGIGTLSTTQENLILKNIDIYKWSTYFSYIQICYWYCTEVNGPFGEPWIADKRFLYLGYTNNQLEVLRMERI